MVSEENRLICGPEVYDTAIENLAIAIIERAIYDYKKFLRKRYVDGNKRERVIQGIKGLEKFFKGEWCDLILKGTGCRITGEDIMKLIYNSPGCWSLEEGKKE